jgi:hypothetical protein
MDEFMDQGFRDRQFEGDLFVGFSFFKAGKHLHLARPKPRAGKPAVAPAEGNRFLGRLGTALIDGWVATAAPGQIVLVHRPDSLLLAGHCFGPLSRAERLPAADAGAPFLASPATSLYGRAEADLSKHWR